MLFQDLPRPVARVATAVSIMLKVASGMLALSRKLASLASDLVHAGYLLLLMDTMASTALLATTNAMTMMMMAWKSSPLLSTQI